MRIKNRFKFIILSIVAFFIVASVVIFILSPGVRSLFKSKSHFKICSTDDRVLFEPGAEAIGSIIAGFLNTAINMVETGHFKKFEKPFKVYVFASVKSHNEYTGNPTMYPIRGTARLGDVYISPAAFSFRGFDTHRETLAHELSHLLLAQLLGLHRFSIPHWFSEGLANCIAGSGGEGVTEEAAIRAILMGRHFILREKSSLFGSFYKKNFPGLTGPMFHRQNIMFFKFIMDKDVTAYKNFLINIQEGSNFSKSFQAHFGCTIKEMWHNFKNHIAQYH